MSVLDFLTEATKEQCKLRLAVAGPSGSGKTFSSINILMHLGCENIAVLDTEHGSAAKYSNDFPRKFKVIDNRYWKSNYDPRRLITVLKELGPHVDGIVCDSLTHFWMGPGGMLTLVDDFAKKAAARGGKYDSFGAWKQADPIYNELIQTILALPCHFAACLRAKSEYEDVEVGGKKKKQKVGMAAQIREGFEYEFDVEGMMTMNHDFIVGKTRCHALDEQIFNKPGANIAKPLLEWMNDGVPKSEPKAATPTPASSTPVAGDQPKFDSQPKQEAAPLSTTSIREELLGLIKTAENDEQHKANAITIRKAKEDGRLDPNSEDYTFLSKAYAAHGKALKEKAA